ncbi:beta-hexosaminidase 3 [Tripterygium wilfordii]|uniref:beta-N-acetylhexosaminidase n=1 Tax=Tripterygium wilfordii TaxID=458696 RepID=A0A7J7CTZ4_TRIWF|nr:beta-hexosaminidase 3 [Tripterygium wilfordii]
MALFLVLPPIPAGDRIALKSLINLAYRFPMQISVRSLNSNFFTWEVMKLIQVAGRTLPMLEEKGMNELQAYQHFVLRVQNIALSHGYEVVNWYGQETFNKFGDKLNKKTVVHNWYIQLCMSRVVAAGLRCIVSNMDAWYLDFVKTPWQNFYANEPLNNIKDPKLQKLVLGGEVCMWGERVDGSDIEQTVWPRAAAASERLWTPLEKLAKDPNQVTERLEYFRFLLNQRGVAAAPLDGLGRAVPEKPGSCFVQ